MKTALHVLHMEGFLLIQHDPLPKTCLRDECLELFADAGQGLLGFGHHLRRQAHVAEFWCQCLRLG